MPNLKSRFILALCLCPAFAAVPALGETRVLATTQLADVTAGPSTGGGDTPYLSTGPTKPGAQQVAPQTPAVPQHSAVPMAPQAVAPIQPTPSVPSEAIAPQSASKAPGAQPAAATVQIAEPPKPAASMSSSADAKPEPVTPPQTPISAPVPLPAAPTKIEPTQQITPPTSPAQAAAPARPDEKPRQKSAQKKSMPAHKPDVIVRNGPHGTFRPVPDRAITVYDDAPVPPLPIGRQRHVIIQADNDDDGDYVIVRRYRPVTSCEPHWVPGFWFLHREIHCD